MNNLNDANNIKIIGLIPNSSGMNCFVVTS